jgi:hypothetical protein
MWSPGVSALKAFRQRLAADATTAAAANAHRLQLPEIDEKTLY